MNIGIIPAMISCFIVPKLGAQLSSQMMLSGRKFSAVELHELRALGATEPPSVNAAALRDTTMRFVNAHLLTSSSSAVAHMKRLLRYVTSHSHGDNVVEAQRAFARVFAAPDMQYGLSSFAQKSKPDWTEFLRARL